MLEMPKLWVIFPKELLTGSESDIGFPSLCSKYHWLIKKLVLPNRGTELARENKGKCQEKGGGIIFWVLTATFQDVLVYKTILVCKQFKGSCWAMAAQAFNPSTQEAEASGSL